MFYVASTLATPAPEFIPAVPYLTCKARSASPGGPWIKQQDVVPFRPSARQLLLGHGQPGATPEAR